MIQLTIERDATARAEALLKLIPGGIEKAAASAANRAIDAMKTASGKETASRYRAKAADVKKTLTLKRARAGSPVAEMVSRGRRRPLTLYRVSAGKRRGRVKAAVKKQSGLKPIPKAFMVGGRPMVRMRPDRVRPDWGAMRALVGPAIPQILKNEETVKALEKIGAEKFLERLDHEVWRILNGIGGKGGGRR